MARATGRSGGGHAGASSRPHRLGPVYAVAEIDSGVDLLHAGGRQRIRFIGEGIVAVRLSPHPAFGSEFSYALDPDARLRPPSSVAIAQQGTVVEIAAAGTTLRVDKRDGRMTTFTGARDTLIEDAAPPAWHRLGRPGEATVELRKTLRPGERLLGLGDKAADLDRRGARLEHWNTDAYGFERGSDPLYKSIPFLLGLLPDGTAYGLFVDSFARSTFDLGHSTNDELRISVEGAELAYYLFRADTPLGIVEAFADLTGPTPMLPKWALGYHQCRYSYRTEADMRRVARELRTRRIPCDTLYFDIHYMDDFRVFSWDSKAFPHPERLIRGLRDDGFTTVAIVDPGIHSGDDEDPVFRDGVEHDVFVRRADGERFEGVVWPGPCHFPDFHRPDVRTWWGRHVGGLLEAGIDGIWCDMNEPSVFVEQMTGRKVPRTDRTMPDDVVHHVDGQPTPHREAHNAYGQQMHRATTDAMRDARPGRRPFTITRAAYAGSQRFGTTWTGDNAATWNQLRLGLEQCLSLNVSGFPFCGADVGGFSGEPSGEMMARWTQSGVLTPLFRNHSAVDTPRQEPWLFGRNVEDACRMAIELRYRLLPYLYTVLHDAATRGTPMLRPLDLIHPEDPVIARERPFGMYLGDALLAYPVVAPRRRSVKTYLPEVPGGWFDFHTGEHLAPGFRRVAAPLNRLPLMVRAGTVLPLGPVVQSTKELADQPLTLRVYPLSGTFESNLYDDVGDGWEHEAGQYVRCVFRGEGSADRLVLQTHLEGDFTPPWREFEVEVLGIERPVEHVLADGVVTACRQHYGVLRCTLPVGARLEIGS